MSMLTDVIAFRPPDKTWLKMKKVYDACIEADIDIPDDVEEFFNYEEPSIEGAEVDISNILEEWKNNNSVGYQIDITKLPKDIKILRFYNSW